MSFTEVTLIIAILTGPGQPNQAFKMGMPDMDTCFETAKEFSRIGHLPDGTDAKKAQLVCEGSIVPEAGL